jgi:F-type H+-transporting ATPase subunit b
MSRPTHLRWNAIASLITLAVLLAAGGKLLAFLQSGGEPGGGSPAISQPAEQAAESEGASVEHAAAAGESEHSVWDTVFHWTNFLMIAAGVWYLGKKLAVPLLRQRAHGIQEELQRSSRAMAESSQRLAGIEEKLQRLGDEIRDLRQAASREAAAEQARMEELAQAEAGKIAQAAEQEIATAAKAARRELQRYAAELAVGLAEKRIRESISPDAEQRMLRSFVNDLTDHDGSPSGSEPS